MENNPPVSNGNGKELKYELQLGQLLIIVIVGILLSVGAGYLLGKQIGFSQGTSTVQVDKPAYCNVDKLSDRIKVSCNELGDLSLDSLCRFGSPELKDKVRIVLIGSN